MGRQGRGQKSGGPASQRQEEEEKEAAPALLRLPICRPKGQSRVPIPPQLAPPAVQHTKRKRDEAQNCRLLPEISWNSALGDGNSGAEIPNGYQTIIATR
ncbi:hypothetical protein GUJ93_ZPchr0002g25193 [Zizania palustris]|uniref:Uncharacterized protein n=1 Tax=Zizania palustris TaxID=103762 RepID=A0A8J5V542_ZIZPA|nr:hypothetical protein GUJ93_ZPchr0002g25193 [Zizania palustris]